MAKQNFQGNASESVPKILPNHKIEVKSTQPPNRHSPIASVQRTQSTLAGHSAVPCGQNVARISASGAMRNAAQRTEGL